MSLRESSSPDFSYGNSGNDTILSLRESSSPDFSYGNSDNDTILSLCESLPADESDDEDSPYETEERSDESELEDDLYVRDYSYQAPPPGWNEKMISGAKIIKRSEWTHLIGPRDKDRKKRVKTAELADSDSNNYQRRVDVVAIAVRKASYYVSENLLDVRDGKAEMKEYDLCNDLVFNPERLRTRGWARRPHHGDQYGKKYITEYKDDIRELFNIGKRDSERKLNPRKMLETMRKKYPNIYTLPSETSIKQHISKLFKEQKDSGSNEVICDKVRSKLSGIYEKKLEEYLEKDDKLRPNDAYNTLVREFTGENGELPDDFPGKKKAKSKFSSLKAAKKKKALTDII